MYCEYTMIACLLECLPLWYKNVIKIHFAMKTLKRINMVMWALETKLVQPKGYGSPWLLGYHGMSSLCHNPIFTHGIFSGVGTQNGTAWTRPDQSNRDPSFQNDPRILPRAPLPKFEEVWPNSTRVDQVWPGLTKFDRGLTKPFLTCLSPIYLEILKTWSGIHFPDFGELWPSLTKFD